MSSLFGIGGGGNVGAAGGSFYPYSIDQSLRFNDDDSAKLTRTPASAGNRATWTWSGWVKRGNLGVKGSFFCSTAGDYNLQFFTDNKLKFEGAFGAVVTDAVFRDVSSFYHILAVHDTTEVVSSDRFKIYVNGVQQTTSGTYPSGDGVINNTVEHGIGGQTSINFFDGYMAEVNFIDGTALDPTSFGEDINGVWVPKAYSGSYGTNGFYLDFSTASYTDNASDPDVFADQAGSNDWNAYNLAASDIVPDSPTNNFATLNPLYDTGAPTHAEGNLQVSDGSTAAGASTYQIPKTGKWYFESKLTAGGGVRVGVSAQDVNIMNVNNFLPTTGGTGNYFNSTSGSGTWIDNGTGVATGGGTSSFTANVLSNVLGVTVDVENLEIYFQADVGSGLEVIGPFTINSSHTDLNIGFNMNADTVKFNFGQDSSFSGSVTSGSAEAPDANGVGDFYYTPPTGALALCTANLPEATIGPNSTTTSDEHFNTVLWTGDGAASRSITGINHASDFVWIKTRNQANEHSLFDSVRGVAKDLESNSTAAEQANNIYGYINSFDSDGFTVDAGTTGAHLVNYSGSTYVGWSWKAGGTAVLNEDGTIDSQVSANVTAGFSLTSWTTSGTTHTVGHGLDAVPEMIITKARNAAYNWDVYHFTATPNGSNRLILNSTSAVDTFDPYANVSPTDSVFSFDGSFYGSGINCIAYCFHSVDGFSRVTSYVGNGSTDGTFCHLGHRPAWIMLKNASASGAWYIFDVARNTYNAMDNYLRPNLSNTEGNLDFCDFTSNGFKIRSSAAEWNGSGNTIIVLSFAEQPFKYANAR